MRAAETIIWAGGEHRFRLGIGELRAIEQACDAGVSVVLLRLLGSQWKLDDVLAPIRLGLLGGGMPDTEVRATMERVTSINSPFELAVNAAEILKRFIMWETDDAPGEQEAGADQNQTRSPTDGHDGPDTTAAEP